MIIRIKKDDDILGKLYDALEGKLPDMNSKEKYRYNNDRNELVRKYNKVLELIEDYIEDKQKSNRVSKQFIEYTEFSNSVNGLLNELYYKEGLRDGIKVGIICK